jgi:VWFA-related protein
MKKYYVFPLILIAALSAALLKSEDQSNSPSYKFSVETQLVEVFLKVAKGKQFIQNLSASDFKVVEDGVPVSIDRLDNQKTPLQIALLFDMSESVRDSLKSIQDSATAFVESLEEQDRVTLVLFNSDIRYYQQTSRDKKPIIREIKNAQAQGMTRLYDALLFSMRYLNEKQGRKAIICFSDGQDTSGSSSRTAVLNAAGKFGIPIYAIGEGAGLELTTLKMILRQFADINSGKAYFIQNLSKLKEAFRDIGTELRSSYVLAYYTQVSSDGRWHEFNVKTINPEYQVHSRKGFFAQRSSDTADVSNHK